MLSWLTGPQLPDLDDDSRAHEPPETPAPVFALRAFKSALFGTPGMNADGESIVSSEPRGARVHIHKSQDAGNQNQRLTRDRPTDRLLTMEKRQSVPSPTKSILMTPGTNAIRRKTVSFGEGVGDAEKQPMKGRSGLPPDFPGKFPSPWTPRVTTSSPTKSKLTRSLINARETNTSQSSAKGFLGKVQNAAKSENDASLRQSNDLGSNRTGSKEAEETVNLNEPQSKSGRYWKSEYERFESKSNREIKRLLQYRHIAKSYAQKKDAEALRLAERLRQEEAKVARMEERVISLAAKMAGKQGPNQELEGVQIVEELAKQTTLTLHYKQKIDKLREKLEEHDVMDDGNCRISKDEEEQARRVALQLETAIAKIAELTAENGELRKLQQLAKATEAKASKLSRDNEVLKTSLARVKEQMNTHDDLRWATEEKLKTRENRLESRNEEYRIRIGKMKQEREQTETSLRRRFEQEISRLQGILEARNITTANLGMYRSSRHALDPREADNPAKSVAQIIIDDTGGPSVEIWTGNDIGAELPLNDESVLPGWTCEQDPTPRYNDVYTTATPAAPALVPFSRDPVFSNNNVSKGGISTDPYSPRPSIVNCSLDLAPTRRPSVPNGHMKFLDINQGLSSGRTGGLNRGTKKALPPDRTAAAKARLEQRRAEKRRLGSSGKENVGGVTKLQS